MSEQGTCVWRWHTGEQIHKHWPILLLLGISLVTHLMWLSYPRQVVFDEVHFGKFVTAYCCTHESFFDIHPPHGKLLIAGAAYLTGYRGGLPFEHIGQPYGEVSPLGLRLVPALSGVLLPIVMFGLLRQLGASRGLALLGGLALVFDNALTVQTRIIALDGMMLLALMGSLSAYLKAEERIGQRVSWGGWWPYCLLAGALAGLAVGVKFTGLTAGALLAVLLLVRLVRSRTWQQLAQWFLVGGLIAVGAVFVYGLGWAAHFALLPLPGAGDEWRIPQWEGALPVSFVRETAILHKIMYDANYGLTASHPDASSWWSWPLMGTSVFYWQYDTLAGTKEGQAGGIYLLGNPLLWWGTAALFAVTLAAIGWSSLVSIWQRFIIEQSSWRTRMSWLMSWSDHKVKIWIPLVGYLVALVPLIRVPRALFLYHYFTPLIFSLLAGLLWLEWQGWFGAGRVKQEKVFLGVVAGMLGVMFVVFSPLTYGFVLPTALYESLFWLEGWR